jgi:hypothetical protein
VSGRLISTKGVGSAGDSLATKGLLDREASSVVPVVIPIADLVPPKNLWLETSAAFRLSDSDASVIVVIPTAINTCLIAAENITDNLRAKQASDLELPSLYKRAFLVAYETDETALVRK